MAITWLEIKRFRHVRPGTRLEFAPGLNVVLGRNGTGKTNLLELLAAVAAWDFRAFEREKFDVTWEQTLPDGRVRVGFRYAPGDAFGGMMPRTADGGRGAAPSWDATIHLFDAQGVEVLTVQAGPDGSTWRGGGGEVRLPDRLDAPLRWFEGFWARTYGVAHKHMGPDGRLVMVARHEVGASFTGALINAHNSPMGRLDEALEVFHRQLVGHADHASSGYQFIVVEKVWDDEPVVYGMAAPPRFKEALHTSVLADPDRTDHTVTAADVPVLAQLRDAFGLADFHATARRARRDIEDGIATDVFVGLTFTAVLANGTTYDHRGFSFGQKRLLAYLWAVASTSGPVIADEPANGLHYDWIELCMKAIGDRQAFIASQNPLLFDFLSFDDAAAAQRSLIRCTLEAGDGATGWCWRNLSGDEAARLFDAYSLNFQQVSELLRLEGLW